jgi:hypothetical protein
LQTPRSQQPAHLDRVEHATNALLVGVHEGDHSGEDGADVPAGTPGLLVVVREGGADGLADLEAAVVGEEAYFGWGEGVVLGEFEQAVIESLFILFFEVVEEEVEGEVALALHKHAGNGVLLDGLPLLVDSDVGDLLTHLSYMPILC